MIEHKKIKVHGRYVEAMTVKLMAKNLIVLRGSKGYIMCGYLNLRVAEQCKDVAVKITGVTSISDALGARVFACTRTAAKLGIYKGQPVKDVLTRIA